MALPAWGLKLLGTSLAGLTASASAVFAVTHLKPAHAPLHPPVNRVAGAPLIPGGKIQVELPVAAPPPVAVSPAGEVGAGQGSALPPASPKPGAAPVVRAGYQASVRLGNVKTVTSTYAS